MARTPIAEPSTESRDEDAPPTDATSVVVPVGGACRRKEAQSPKRGALRSLLRALAIRAHLYPHITLNCMPFKTYEFAELIQGTQFSKQDRVLDLGCGTGTQTLIVGQHCGTVVGVDIDADWIERARHYGSRFAPWIHSEFHLGAVEALGLDAASFDKVLSFCVIEHIPNAEDVVRELYRLLRPGGELILSADSLAPIHDADLIASHRKQFSVSRYYTPKSLRTLLEEPGFIVDSLYPIFRSDFAIRKFEAGIRNGFRFGYLAALRDYWRLCFHERRAADRDGLFLIARCHKA